MWNQSHLNSTMLSKEMPEKGRQQRDKSDRIKYCSFIYFHLEKCFKTLVDPTVYALLSKMEIQFLQKQNPLH